MYQHGKPDLKQRTKNRLQQIINLGMVEVGVYEFGVPNIMSGLYLEKIWSYNDEAWADYIQWATNLIHEKK